MIKIIFCSLFYALSHPLMAVEGIISCPHGEISFKIEIAQTTQERTKGLMNRKDLGENEGMLFISLNAGPVKMWMKNTPLSLDMIFCDQKGKILTIVENTIPYSLKIIGPFPHTAQVLELLGGTVKKHDITKECLLKPVDLF